MPPQGRHRHIHSRSLQVKKMKLEIYIITLFLIFECIGQTENSNSEKLMDTSNTETETTINTEQENINLINDLLELSIIKESESYESVKKSIAKERIELKSRKIKIIRVEKIPQGSFISL